jgi:hypothetical protein
MFEEEMEAFRRRWDASVDMLADLQGLLEQAQQRANVADTEGVRRREQAQKIFEAADDL